MIGDTHSHKNTNVMPDHPEDMVGEAVQLAETASAEAVSSAMAWWCAGAGLVCDEQGDHQVAATASKTAHLKAQAAAKAWARVADLLLAASAQQALTGLVEARTESSCKPRS